MADPPREAPPRLTDRVRGECRRLGHDYIGTGHMLLGLLGEEDGPAVRALEGLGLDRSAVRDAVEARLPPTSGASPEGQLPFTPRAARVLDLSLVAASGLGQDRITSAHLLLGLLRARDGVAGRALAALGVDAARVREHLR